MLTDTILREAAKMIASVEYVSGHYADMHDMHDILGLNWAAHQHQIIRQLTNGSVSYLRDARMKYPRNFPLAQ